MPKNAASTITLRLVGIAAIGNEGGLITFRVAEVICRLFCLSRAMFRPCRIDR